MDALQLKHIRKRDGVVVVFDRVKIENAIKKAFYSQGYSQNGIVVVLCDEVIEQLNKKFDNSEPPTVEQIQDRVEEALMRHGYTEVARAYIIYRDKHRRIRQAKIQETIDRHELTVVGEEDILHFFDKQLMYEKFKKISAGLKNVDSKEVLNLVCKGLYEGVHQKEIDHLTLKEIEYKMEEHYDYGYFGARIVLDQLYKGVLHCSFASQNLEKSYHKRFAEYVHQGVEEEILTEKMRDFDLELLAKALVPERDLLFDYLGVKILYDRYLLKTRNKDEQKKLIFELPQWMWMRVAMGLAMEEEDKNARALEFYNVLSNHYLISSTPTLFNSGTRFMQLSSCYINLVGDSLSGIFKNFSDDAQLSKWAGGIGTDWTGVRATGSVIKGTNGASSGIIPFIKIFNDIAIAVNQGGKRRGAMAAYLENWHLDTEEFLELKKNTGDERRRAHDIHPAIFVSDLFMKRVEEDGQWMLFSPDDARFLHENYGKFFEEKYLELEKNPPINHKVVRAKDLWRKMLTMLYETGHPWITFKDAINVRSPQDHVGMVHSSNLCTEITLNTSTEETAVCNLASLNLSRMVRDGKLDEKLVETTIATGMRMLDCVIDINFYPTEEARRANVRHRPVGLGVMGYHDAIFKLGIPYSSDEQVDFADHTMEIISYHAILTSSKLAKEKGAYSTYEGSKWSKGILPLDTLDLLEKNRGQKIEINRAYRMDWDKVRRHIAKHGMRNSNCMAIAPTATIANIAGVVPCVEPIYKNIYMKENLSGNFFIINNYLIDRLKEINVWNRNIIDEIKLADGSIMNIKEIPDHLKNEFREVFEIDQKWIIKAAAARSKWIDQSASTNLFIDTRSGKEISDIYFLAWKMGMKTTYYLRSRAVSQITKTVGEGVDERESDILLEKEEELLTDEQREKNERPFNVNGAMPLTKVRQQSKSCLLSDPDCEACQ